MHFLLASFLCCAMTATIFTACGSDEDEPQIPAEDTQPGQACDAEIIDKWHRARGFAMIGYHYVVMPDGNVEHGRPLFYQGAHCKEHGMNAKSIGICYVGGRKVKGGQVQYADTRTAQQKYTLRKLIHFLRERYPGVQVVGHRDFNPGKACPCFDAKAEYSRADIDV